MSIFSQSKKKRDQWAIAIIRCVAICSFLYGWCVFPLHAFAVGDSFFGNQPGGKTIGGPSVTTLRAGTEKNLFSFIRSGPDPFVFVCTTGLNKGSGMVTLSYRTRLGGTQTSKFSPGDSAVVCGEVTAISVECHSGRHSQCEFLWRVDVLR